MSGNIHSIGEFNNNRGQRGAANPPPPGGYSSPPLLGAGMTLGTPDSARKESFWDMLKFLFCPFFTSRSFIFAVTVCRTQIVDILMYFASVGYDPDSSSFLTPTNHSLDELGAKDAYRIQNENQLWRFLVACILHANLWHIIFNMIMQMILGFRLEPTVGFKHTAIVYILSGIGGNLLSACCAPNDLGVGASGAIFGMNSAMVRSTQIAWIIMNWEALAGDPYRLMGLIWLIMILVLNLFFGFVRYR